MPVTEVIDDAVTVHGRKNHRREPLVIRAMNIFPRFGPDHCDPNDKPAHWRSRALFALLWNRVGILIASMLGDRGICRANESLRSVLRHKNCRGIFKSLDIPGNARAELSENQLNLIAETWAYASHDEMFAWVIRGLEIDSGSCLFHFADVPKWWSLDPKELEARMNAAIALMEK